MRRLDFMYSLEIAKMRLREECPDTADYRANLEHNAGSWNGWTIYRVTDGFGITWYCAGCCRNASKSLAAVRRVCARN